MTPNDIPVEALRALFAYDRSAGRLVWAVGSEAGQPVAMRVRSGYRMTEFCGMALLEHRVVWALEHGRWPSLVDHRDRDKLNNRPENLREASRSENAQNRVGAKGRSGIRGVFWDTKRGKWCAHAMVDGKTHWLGAFDTVDAAAEARRAGVARLHPCAPSEESSICAA